MLYNGCIISRFPRIVVDCPHWHVRLMPQSTMHAVWCTVQSLLVLAILLLLVLLLGTLDILGLDASGLCSSLVLLFFG